MSPAKAPEPQTPLITWNKRSPALHPAVLWAGTWKKGWAQGTKSSPAPGSTFKGIHTLRSRGQQSRKAKLHYCRHWEEVESQVCPRSAPISCRIAHSFPTQSLSFPIYNRKAFDLLKVLRLSASLVARSPSLALKVGVASPLGLRGRQPEKPLSGLPRKYSASVHCSIRFIRTQHTPMSMAHVDDVIFHSCCITCFATLYGASALCFSCQGSKVEINPLWITNSFSGSPSDSPPA